MRIIRLHQTPPTDNRDLVREAMAGRSVAACGVAEFAPHTVAHEGEDHRHEHDEVFIILGGEITVPGASGESPIARAGDWVHVPAGTEHHLTNHTHLPCSAMYMVLAEPTA